MRQNVNNFWYSLNFLGRTSKKTPCINLKMIPAIGFLNAMQKPHLLKSRVSEPIRKVPKVYISKDFFQKQFLFYWGCIQCIKTLFSHFLFGLSLYNHFKWSNMDISNIRHKDFQNLSPVCS